MSRGPRSSALVVALGLASLVLAQTVCFAVVWWLPRPPPASMNVGEAVQVLLGQTPARQFGLLDWMQASPPEGDSDAAMTALVAPHLFRTPDDVRLIWWRPDNAPMVQVVRSGTVLDPEGPLPSGTSDTLLLPALRWPAFVLAVRVSGDLWRVVTVVHEDSWRRHVLLALAAGAILLAPLVAWAAIRIGQPLRRLADASSALTLHEVAMLPDTGPREVRMLARAMNQAHARLRAQAEEMTRMLAAVAHDLRTPLTGLRLRAETAPPEQAERMIGDIARMDQMIEQVLGYARGELMPAQHSPLDLQALLLDCAHQARLRGVPLHSTIHPLPAFQGDELLLRRAIDNLIDNAARYASDVEVSAAQHLDGLVIDIADRGPGIPDAEKDRVLKPFERQERSRNRATGGSGLGLAVASGAARQHGGTLRLLDRPGGGLLARIHLPFRAGDSA